MVIARITGQGLSSIAVLVILLWSCVIGNRVIMQRAQAEGTETLRAMRELQFKQRHTPASIPVHTSPRRARPSLG
jgi:hypothetical protein